MSLAPPGAVLTLSTAVQGIAGGDARSTLSLGKGDGRGRVIGEAGGASNVRLNIEEICLLVIYFRSLYYIMITYSSAN